VAIGLRQRAQRRRDPIVGIANEDRRVGVELRARPSDYWLGGGVASDRKRAQASRRCETQAPLSGRPLALLAFRSLDPFRALREPGHRRRDEERLSPETASHRRRPFAPKSSASLAEPGGQDDRPGFQVAPRGAVSPFGHRQTGTPAQPRAACRRSRGNARCRVWSWALPRFPSAREHQRDGHDQRPKTEPVAMSASRPT